MPDPTERASHSGGESSLREKVARALMEARGGCDVTDWREAEWNPSVAQALAEADAAIAVCMEEAAKVAETMHEDDDGMDRQVKRHIASAIRSLIPTSEAE